MFEEMKKNIWCFLGIHKWSKWRFIGHGFGKFGDGDKLSRHCEKCKKEDCYIGITEVCMTTGEKTPYIMKH